MKALVTGGGGFLGLYLTEQLVGRGDQVRVLCRGEYPRLRELNVDYHKGDVRDLDTVTAACADQEAVFHTAALPGVWGSWSMFYETNAAGTENVIAACREQGVGKLIYTSSPSVVFDGTEHTGGDESLPYSDRFLCHYPHTKAIAERAVLAANGQNGLATCSLRPHLMWGPRDNHIIPRLIQTAKQGRLRRVGSGRNLISISYVENAARAHLQAADALNVGSPVAGEAYFINEIEPVNLWQWVDQLLALAGLPPVKRALSARAARVVGALQEVAYRVLPLRGEPAMTRFLAEQLGNSHHYSVAKAQRDFGYNPQVSFDEAMRRLGAELATANR